MGCVGNGGVWGLGLHPETLLKSKPINKLAIGQLVESRNKPIVKLSNSKHLFLHSHK